MFRTIALILALSTAAFAATYRVRDVGLCLEENCSGTENTVEWTYGSSSRGGSATITYNPDGDAEIEVTGHGTYNSATYTVTTRVDLGTTGKRECTKILSPGVTFTNQLLTECGFAQEFDALQVYRTNVLCIRQHFRNSNSAVQVVGHRKVYISFTLKLEHPANESTPTPKPTQLDLSRCLKYRHKLTPYPAQDCNDFLVSLEADGYDPSLTGIGFRPLDCFIHYGVTQPDGTVVYSTFLSSPVFPVSSIQIIQDGAWLEPQYLTGDTIVPGESYAMQWHRIFHREVSLADTKNPPKVQCTVCLCSMRQRAGLPQCPQDLHFLDQKEA